MNSVVILGVIMTKIENFLNSNLYIASVFLFTFISWSFLFETPPFYFNVFNMFGLFILVLTITLCLSFFSNSLYALPPSMGMFFVVNHPSLTFDTTTLFFPILMMILLVSGFIIHLVRFKPILKKGRFYLGFLLLAFAYVIPLIYTPFQFKAIPVSMMAFFYFVFYVFFRSTMKGNLDFLFKLLLSINLLMCAQMAVYLLMGFLGHPELSFYERLFVGWDRNLGWANVNDMCFYIALTFPSYIYFIFKKPKTYLNWFLMLIPILIVILSKSRGGIIGFGASIAGIIYFAIYQGEKVQLKHGLIFGIFLIVFFYINKDIIYLWWTYFNDTATGDLNEFSSNRLFLYREGWRMFLRYPLFGAGWMSIDRVAITWYETYGAYQRLFMYHSTFFHTIATMGLFGLGALILHFTQIFKFLLKKMTLEKYLFMIGFVASQLHGLIDNVQFAVPYMGLLVLILPLFETAQKKTSFMLVNNRYKLKSEHQL